MAKKQKIGNVAAVHGPTARVRVDRMLRHPIYEKAHRSTRSLLAHVPTGTDVMVGDTVRIEEIRPISKRKSWMVLEVTERPALYEDPSGDSDQAVAEGPSADATAAEESK